MGHFNIPDEGARSLQRLPVYKQLQQIFVGMIKSGAWKPNHALPNELQLANQFSVSIGTIRKVVDELSSLGLVSRQQGRGTFVNDAVGRGYRALFEPIRNADGTPIRWDPIRSNVAFGSATADERRELDRQGPELDVVRLSWLRSTNKRALAYQEIVVPMDLCADWGSATHTGDLGALFNRAGVLVERIEEYVTTRALGFVPAQKLGRNEGDIALHASSKYFDDLGLIVGTSELWMKLDGEVFACARSVRHDR